MIAASSFGVSSVTVPGMKASVLQFKCLSLRCACVFAKWAVGKHSDGGSLLLLANHNAIATQESTIY